MAFNFNFFKGSTTQQIQGAIHYWMNALRPAEEVERMKQEKEREIEENAIPCAVDDQVGAEGESSEHSDHAVADPAAESDPEPALVLSHD